MTKTIETISQNYFLFDEQWISLGEPEEQGIIPIQEDDSESAFLKGEASKPVKMYQLEV